jgi:hypothetical protein
MRAPRYNHPFIDAPEPAPEPKLEVRSVVTMSNGPELRASVDATILGSYMQNSQPQQVVGLEVRDARGRWLKAFVRAAHMIGVRDA